MLINIREVSRANVTIHMLHSSTRSEMGRDIKIKEGERDRRRARPVREARAAQDGGQGQRGHRTGTNSEFR